MHKYFFYFANIKAKKGKRAELQMKLMDETVA